MTQKRGLGRGLGALIPGAGQGTAREEATDRREDDAHAVPPGTDDAPAGAAEETGALRTRNHPRTSPEPGEPGATSRPVDMFFSGDPHVGTERSGPRSSGGRDVAGAMARAAAERRAQAALKKTPSGRKGVVTAGAAAEKGAAADAKAPAEKSAAADVKAPAAQTAAKDSPAVSASASPTSTSAKSASPKSTAPKATAATSTASPKRSRTRKTTAPASTDASEAPVQSAPVPVDTEAAVEVETVMPTPADSPAETMTPASADGSDAADTAPAETAISRDDEAAPRGDLAVSPDAENPADDATSGSPGDDLLPVPGAEFAEIPIQEIRENPRNPRTVFDDDALDELAYSLREVGVLQPVVVRPIPVTDEGESFELVMGERRWRAARRAGLPSIPAIIRETSDDDLLRDALLENLHRSQLNPLEEAAAYSQLLEDFGCTQDELAERIGRSRPQISNTLRLMRLPPLVQRRLASGAISAGHARALLPIEQPQLMEELAQRIVAEGLSVRAVERLVSRGVEPATSRTTPPRRTSYHPRVVDITSRLSNRLEAPVRIDVGKRKGRITLEFTNLDDLERLIERIGLDAGPDDGEQLQSEG